MDLTVVGPWAFGAVIGWITYRTLRRKEGSSALSDIATVIAALGGATILAMFKTEREFGAYCVGLFVGFFAYLIVYLIIGEDSVEKWMGK